MEDKTKEMLPDWYKNLNEYNAIITNDIDSLLSYYLIKKVFPDVKISGFYNFTSYYHVTNSSEKKLFGIDMDTIKGRTFGNHITYFHKNEDAINLNNIYNIEKYHAKYPLSTALLIFSLYNFNLEDFTDEQLQVLLAIDSAYKGYYTKNDYFREIYIDWLDRLDIRKLEDRILQHMDSNGFEIIKKEYNTYGTIEVINNRLYTNINLGKLSVLFGESLELPQDNFIENGTYENVIINPMEDSVPDVEYIISMAWIYKDMLKMTLK